MLATAAPPSATNASSLADPALPSSNSTRPTAFGGPIVRQATLSVHGMPTNLVLLSYTDRTVVLVTQLGRVGTLIQVDCASPATTPSTSSGGAAESRAHLLDQRLLGAETPLHSVYATEIAHAVSSLGVVMPVLVGLGLRPLSTGAASLEEEEPDLEQEMGRLREVVVGVEALIRRGE